MALSCWYIGGLPDATKGRTPGGRERGCECYRGGSTIATVPNPRPDPAGAQTGRSAQTCRSTCVRRSTPPQSRGEQPRGQLLPVSREEPVPTAGSGAPGGPEARQPSRRSTSRTEPQKQDHRCCAMPQPRPEGATHATRPPRSRRRQQNCQRPCRTRRTRPSWRDACELPRARPSCGQTCRRLRLTAWRSRPQRDEARRKPRRAQGADRKGQREEAARASTGEQSGGCRRHDAQRHRSRRSRRPCRRPDECGSCTPHNTGSHRTNGLGRRRNATPDPC